MRWQNALQVTQSDLVLSIAPRIAKLPLPIQRFDDPFLPFGKQIIAATTRQVCAYLFDFAAYFALGGAGMVALERTLAFARANDRLTILDGAFAVPDYAESCGVAVWAVDGVTVANLESLSAYQAVCRSGAFLIAEEQKAYSTYAPLQSRLYIQPAKTSLRVLGEDILYQHRGDDFATALSKTLNDMRDKS
jgi:hypothetical protein